MLKKELNVKIQEDLLMNHIYPFLLLLTSSKLIHLALRIFFILKK
jgi:hypothetical protein